MKGRKFVRGHVLRAKVEVQLGHHLPWHNKCCEPHGHTYKVEVGVTGELDANGVVMDLGLLKAAMREVVPDHMSLNEIMPNPTCELFAEYLLGQLEEHYLICTSGVEICEITIWETSSGGDTLYTPAHPLSPGWAREVLETQEAYDA
jgi:6-pyruvoyl-tetrahydropterin synthase